MTISQAYRLIREKYNTSDIVHRMANGAFWSFSGTALAKFIVLIAGIVCARILGKDLYGELGMVRSTISLFVTLGMAGLGLTATKFISEYRKNNPERIPSIYLLTTWFSLGIGILISILIIVLAPIIADKSLNSPHLTNDIRWGGILLFFTVLNGVQNGILSGFEDFKDIALNTLWGSIAESILMCVGAYYAGVLGAVIGYGTGFIVIYLCNKLSISKLLKRHSIEIKRSKFRKSDLRLIYTFSLPAVLSSLMIAPVYWIIKAMLVRDNGYGQLAIYEAADQWKIIIMFIPAAISNIVLPILSSLVNDSKSQFWKVLKLNIILNAGISFVLTVAVCLLAKYIMTLYGNDFSDTHTLMILCTSTIFSSIASVVGLSISSRNKMWIGFFFNLNWGIMTIAFTYIFLANGLGATALALGILVSYILHTTFQFLYLRSIMRQSNIKSIIKNK